LLWMKLSEIARYWAAKELTAIERDGDRVTLRAPFACPAFTLRVAGKSDVAPQLTTNGQPMALREATDARNLQPGVWIRDAEGVIACFDLPRGRSSLLVGSA